MLTLAPAANQSKIAFSYFSSFTAVMETDSFGSGYVTQVLVRVIRGEGGHESKLKLAEGSEMRLESLKCRKRGCRYATS